MTFRNLDHKRGRLVDSPHLANLRRLPCVVCGRHGPSEAAHVRLCDASQGIGQAGMASKPGDHLALPLCADHHRNGKSAEHAIGTVRFWQIVGIDPLALALKLHAAKTLEKMAVVLMMFRATHEIADPGGDGVCPR